MTDKKHKPATHGVKKSTKWNSRVILWPCMDCGRDIQPVRNGKRVTWYVKDAVWKKAGAKPNEFLCRECLQKRLGRPLNLADYKYMTSFLPVSRKQWRYEIRQARKT